MFNNKYICVCMYVCACVYVSVYNCIFWMSHIVLCTENIIVKRTSGAHCLSAGNAEWIDGYNTVNIYYNQNLSCAHGTWRDSNLVSESWKGINVLCLFCLLESVSRGKKMCGKAFKERGECESPSEDYGSAKWFNMVRESGMRRNWWEINLNA